MKKRNVSVVAAELCSGVFETGRHDGIGVATAYGIGSCDLAGGADRTVDGVRTRGVVGFHIR